MKKSCAALVILLLLAAPAWSATKTVTLSVPSMDCPVCPITVKKSLSKVQGVSKTEVSFERREAIVSFDDTQTSVETLIKATTNAGYPSTLSGSRK